MIDNDDILNRKVKELNTVEDLQELSSKVNEEASKNLISEISSLREKINSKLIEAENKEKHIEERERDINEAYESLLEDEKKEFKKLEIEMERTNYYNTLDDYGTSQLRLKDIIEKIKLSQFRTAPSAFLFDLHEKEQYKSKVTFCSVIDDKQLNENVVKKNLVSNLRKEFKKKGSIVLDGLNIGCVYNCTHSKTKSKKHSYKSPSLNNLDKNKYASEFKSNDKDSSLLNNHKLNKTFYLTQTKKLDMFGSVDVDLDTVCGQYCCNKFCSAKYQYHAATHRNLLSKHNINRNASAKEDFKRNKTQIKEISGPNPEPEGNQIKVEEDEEKCSNEKPSKSPNVSSLDVEKNVIETKINLNDSLAKDIKSANTSFSKMKLKRIIPYSPGKKLLDASRVSSKDSRNYSNNYSSNDVREIIRTNKTSIDAKIRPIPKKDLNNSRNSLNSSVNNSRTLNDSKLSNSSRKSSSVPIKKPFNTKAIIQGLIGNLDNREVVYSSVKKGLNISKDFNDSHLSLNNSKLLNKSNMSFNSSRARSNSKLSNKSKVLYETPKKPINISVKKIVKSETNVGDSNKKIKESLMKPNEGGKNLGKNSNSNLSKNTKANSVTKKKDSVSQADNKKNVSKPEVQTKKAVTPAKNVADPKKVVTPSNTKVDPKKSVTPSNTKVDPKKSVTPNKTSSEPNKNTTTNKPNARNNSKSPLSTSKILNDSKKEINTSKNLNEKSKTLTSSKTLPDSKKDSNSAKTLTEKNNEAKSNTKNSTTQRKSSVLTSDKIQEIGIKK